MSAPPSSADVAVVGAGPTGLVLGCVLARERVPFVLLDRLAEGLNTSRAAVIHARTLEVLEELAVIERLCAEGVVTPTFVMRDRDKVLARIPFGRLPTRYPYTLMVPQQVTEAILLARLYELHGHVYRPCEVLDLAQDADGVTLTVRADGGEVRTVRARYVVGADGMHSAVRERAGIGFTGERYEQSFVLADVRTTRPLTDCEVFLCFSPDGLVVVAPLPGGRHRIVATVDDAPEHPTREDVQRLLDARGPTIGTNPIEEVFWTSRFRVHHRLADRYRAGRVLLAGDAAHVHSPAGGQGMNTGIRDAVVLGHALAAVVAGRADESALDAYERTRRPAARRVVALTDRMTRVATLRGAIPRAVRNALLRVAFGVPVLPRLLAAELAGLNNRPPAGS